MKITKNALRVLSGLVLAGAFAAAICAWFVVRSLAADPCPQLIAKCNDPSVRAYLISWVDGKIAANRNLQGITQSTAGGPGIARVQLPFDWDKLGVKAELSRIDIVKEEGHFSMRADDGKVVAVFFGGSRRGVLVSLTDDGNFGGLAVSRCIVSRHGRVAVYCTPD